MTTSLSAAQRAVRDFEALYGGFTVDCVDTSGMQHLVITPDEDGLDVITVTAWPFRVAVDSGLRTVVLRTDSEGPLAWVAALPTIDLDVMERAVAAAPAAGLRSYRPDALVERVRAALEAQPLISVDSQSETIEEAESVKDFEVVARDWMADMSEYPAFADCEQWDLSELSYDAAWLFTALSYIAHSRQQVQQAA